MDAAEPARLVDTFAAAVNNRDRDGWVACFHPDFKGYSGLAATESGAPYVGLEGAGAWFDNLWEAYEKTHAVRDQTIAVGNCSLHLIRIEYLGRSSGVVLAPLLTWVAEIRDGRFVYARSHFDTVDGFRDMARLLGTSPSSR